MPKYVVTSLHWEDGVENVSITGTVNGFNCSVVVARVHLPKIMSEAQAQQAYADALVAEWERRIKGAQPQGMGVVVERP